MKRKITSALLCAALLLTLSINVSAQDSTNNIVCNSNNEIVSKNSVEPRVQTGTIVDNGVYRIKNVSSGKYLNVHYGVDADHTNIYQWTGDGSTEQKWRVSYNLATDAYQIYSMSSSGGKYRCVDVTRGGTPLTSGQNIKLYKPTDPTSQEVDIMPLGNNQYKIIMKKNTSLCLTAYGTSNGTSGGTTSTSAGNVFISTYTGAANQKWTFEYTNTKVVVAPTGWLDSVSSTAISGWMWRSDLPNSPTKVYFNLVNNDTGDQYNFSTIANTYRSDLLNAGYGNGYHGFSYTIDWRDYLPGNYTINVFGAEGAVYYLSGSPKTYNNHAIHLIGMIDNKGRDHSTWATQEVMNYAENIGAPSVESIRGANAGDLLNYISNSYFATVYTHGTRESLLWSEVTSAGTIDRDTLSTRDMNAIDYGYFENTECLLLLACSTAETGGMASNRNLAQSFVDKGVETVVAFEGTIYSCFINGNLSTTRHAGYWGKVFVEEIGNGKIVENAKNIAFNKLVENQCDIFNLTEEEYHTKCEDEPEYIYEYIHCGMNTCVILGENQKIQH